MPAEAGWSVSGESDGSRGVLDRVNDGEDGGEPDGLPVAWEMGAGGIKSGLGVGFPVDGDCWKATGTNGTGGAASSALSDEDAVPEWAAGIAAESYCGFWPDESSATAPGEPGIRFEPVAADEDEFELVARLEAGTV